MEPRGPIQTVRFNSKLQRRLSQLLDTFRYCVDSLYAIALIKLIGEHAPDRQMTTTLAMCTVTRLGLIRSLAAPASNWFFNTPGTYWRYAGGPGGALIAYGDAAHDSRSSSRDYVRVCAAEGVVFCADPLSGDDSESSSNGA